MWKDCTPGVCSTSSTSIKKNMLISFSVILQRKGLLLVLLLFLDTPVPTASLPTVTSSTLSTSIITEPPLITVTEQSTSTYETTTPSCFDPLTGFLDVGYQASSVLTTEENGKIFVYDADAVSFDRKGWRSSVNDDKPTLTLDFGYG